MDIDRLLRESWRLTWQHRFLWLIGMFVGGGGGGGGGNVPANLPVRDGADSLAPGGRPPNVPTGTQVERWLTDNLGLLIAIGLLLVFLVLVLLIVSFIAQGGMIRATVGLARGEAVGAGLAWREGVRRFWRFLGLWALALVITLGVLLAVGVLAAALVGLATALEGGGRVAVILLGVLLGLAAFLGLLFFFIVFSIAYAYAQRALVVDDLGPVGALGAGVRLVRRRPGPTALAWLVSVGVAIGAGIAIAIVVIVAVLPLGVAGVAVYTGGGLSGGFIAFVVIAVLLVVAGLWVLGGIVQTFQWSYWTFAYLSLTTPPLPSPPAPSVAEATPA